MDRKSAREMLGALPLKMNTGGPVTYGKGATAEDILAAEESYLANPSSWTPETIYNAIIESGISVEDAIAVGVQPETIQALFTAPAETPAYGGPAPTAKMADDVAAYYGRVMQDKKVSPEERLAMQKIATDRGLTYEDIVAAGVDPNILYQTAPAAPAPTPKAEPDFTSPTPPLVEGIDPFPTSAPASAPDPFPTMPDTGGIYAAGAPALDQTFRDSDPRTEVIEDVGGQQQLTGFDYRPAAKLLSATGSGFSFMPPSVTSRPRTLMGSDQTRRYRQGQAAQDFERLKRSGNYPSFADTSFDADAFNQLAGSYGSLSRSQLNALMRQQALQNRNTQRSSGSTAGSAGGTIAEYIAANPDIQASYESQQPRLGAQTLETFARNHYNTSGKKEMAAGTRAPFTLAASPMAQAPTFNFNRRAGGEGEEEFQTTYTTPITANTGFNRTYNVMAEGGPVKKPEGFVDGGSASADLKALNPDDPLFITETVEEEVNPDMVKRDIPRMEWDGVDRPTPMRPETESKNMLENIISGAGKIPDSVGNYFVRPDETGGPSLVSPRQVGSDLVSISGAIVDAVKEDDSFLKSRSIAEIAPITGEIISGTDAVKFSGLANEARAAGDTKAADLYEQLVTMSVLGTAPLIGMGARAGRRAAINAAEEAIKKGSVTEASKMLNDLDPSIKYEGMRDATVQRLKDKGIMSQSEFERAEIISFQKTGNWDSMPEPKAVYTIDDSGSNSSYVTIKKPKNYAEEGIGDPDEYTIRFSDHSLPRQYSFDRNMYNVSNDYLDETINGKSLEDAIDYVDRLVPATESAKMLDEVDAVNAPRADLDFSATVVSKMQEIALRPSVASDPVAMRFLNQIMDDPDAAIAQYAKIGETNGGKIINTDLVRELSPDYLADRTLAFNVHQPASALSEIMFNKRVAETMGEEGTWIFTGGGPASGKTAGLSKAAEEAADLVLDGTLAKFAKNDGLISKALESGKDVQIVYIDRDPLKALPLALMRAMQSGRPVPLEEFARMHRDARGSIKKLHEKYKDNPNVDIKIIENQKGIGGQQEISIDNLSEMDYDKTITEGFKMLEEARRKPEKIGSVDGGISEAIYQGTKGNYDPPATQSKKGKIAQADNGGNQGNGAGDLSQQKGVNALEVGVDETLSGGQRLRNYTPDNLKTLETLATKATAGTRKADALINAPVEAGSKVGIRLNLNSKIPDAPKGLDKLQTLHKNNFNGKALSYVPYATVENVTFNVNQKGRQGIAAKISNIDVPEAKNKFPAMSVDGNYVPDKNVLLDGNDFVEIGFNPKAHHLFIDMNTGQAVKGADLATVVGDRVYAKGIQYYKKSEAPDPLNASDGTDLPSQVRYQKMKRGGQVERVYNDRKYI